MIKPSGTVAHEQMAAGFRMWFKKLLSGFLFSLILFIVILVIVHSVCESKISKMYIPKIVKYHGNSRLLTFEGSGIVDNIQKLISIKDDKTILASGFFLIFTRDNRNYNELFHNSKKLPKSVLNNSFGFFSMLGGFFSDLFFTESSQKDIKPEKPVNIIGNKSFDINLNNLLFGPILRGKKIVIEPEIRQFFKSESVFKKQYIFTLDKVFNGKINYYQNFYISFIGYSFLIFPVFIFLWFIALRKLSVEKTRDKFIRGAKILPFNVFMDKLRESEIKRKDNLSMGKSSDEIKKINNIFNLKRLKIGELEIPRIYEITHILLLGTTGCGKSVLINQLLKQITDRGDKCIIYDPKGEFYSKHGRAEDLIFYPFDTRSVQYSILNEVFDLPDFHILANSLIQPEKAGENEFFYLGAQEVFAAALMYLYKNNKKSIRDILNFLNLSTEAQATAVKTLPLEYQSALKFLNKDAKSSHDVNGTLTTRVIFLKDMLEMKGDFSFRKYIKDENDKRNLYIMNKASYAGIFKPLMTFIIDTMILECLSLPDVRDDRRIFFIMDEFDSLGKLPAFLNGQKQLRSKGVSLICAAQDLGGFEDTYGKAAMRSFINNFNTNWLFRTNDPKTSQFLSEAIGEQEIKKLNESRSMSPSDMGDRQTLSEQDKIEKLLLPAEFQILKNFQSYFKIANIGITKFNVPEIFYEIKKPDFILNKKAFSIDGKLNKIAIDTSNKSILELEAILMDDKNSTKISIDDCEKIKRRINFMKMIISMNQKGLTISDLKNDNETEKIIVTKKDDKFDVW